MNDSQIQHSNGSPIVNSGSLAAFRWGPFYQKAVEHAAELSMILGVSDRDHHLFEQRSRTCLEERLKASSQLTKSILLSIRRITKNPSKGERHRETEERLMAMLDHLSPQGFSATLARSVKVGEPIRARELAGILNLGVEFAPPVLKFLSKQGVLSKTGRSSENDTIYKYTGKKFEIVPSPEIIRELVFQLGNSLVDTMPRASWHSLQAAFSLDEVTDLRSMLASDEVGNLVSLDHYHDRYGTHNYGSLLVLAPCQPKDTPALAVSDALRRYQIPGSSLMRLSCASIPEETQDKLYQQHFKPAFAKIAAIAKSCTKLGRAKRSEFTLSLIHAELPSQS